MTTLPPFATVGLPRLAPAVSRRSLLHAGGLACLGLGLPQLLRQQARGDTSRQRRQVILVFLTGAPSHLDMFDLKPQAPAEVRG
ncbi:MAG: hypothetical protein ACKOFW_15455, partial [Planctomycetaceae bacterium]